MIKDPNATNSPQDPQRLQKLKIYALDTAIPMREFTFEQGYFDASTTAGDEVDLRLRLDKVIESGGSLSKPSYLFGYQTAIKLPPKDSKKQDHWGYYNGENNQTIPIYRSYLDLSEPTINTLLPAIPLVYTTIPIHVTENFVAHAGWDNSCSAASFCDPNSPQFDPLQCYDCWTTPGFSPTYFSGADREPHKDQMKAGILESIQYPTGGTTTFAYEAHDFSNFPTQDAWMTYDDFEVDDCIDPDPNVDCSPNFDDFTLTAPTFVLIKHSVECDGCGSQSGSGANQNYAIITDGGGFSKSFSYNDMGIDGGIAQTYHYLEAGTYTVTLNAVGTGTYINLTAEWTNPKNPVEPLLEKTAGGLRIQQINVHDGINPNNDEITQYQYTKIENGVEKSSGKLMTPLLYDHYQLEEHYDGAITYICHNLVQTSSSHIPLGSSAQGSTVGYDEVTVLRGINGDFGKSVYQYFNTEELVSPSFFPNLPTRIYNSNGLLGMLTQYKKNSSGGFDPVKQVENHYNGKKFTDADLRAPNPNYQTVEIEGIKFYGPTCGEFYINPYVKFYDVVSEWWRITKSITRDYDQNNPSLISEKETNYTYHELGSGLGGYLRSESTTSVDGTVAATEYAYAEDFTVSSGNVLDQMVNQRIISTPVEVINKLNGKVVSGVFTEFKIDEGNVVPGTSHVLETSSPIVNYVPTRNSHIPTAPYQPRIDHLDYDRHGNPLTASQTNGQPVAHTWTLENSLPSSKVMNATHENCAYSSFDVGVEPDPTNNDKRIDGNWEIFGPGGWNRDDARTGLGRFDVSGNQEIKTKVTNGGTYILSFWSPVHIDLEGRFDITPAYTITSNGTWVVNGWKYFELKMNLLDNQEVKIKGNQSPLTYLNWLDELRLHPEGAQMQTICYDDQLRTHTVTDANNISLFYTYDELGRLIEVRDFEGNLLNVKEYHYHRTN